MRKSGEKRLILTETDRHQATGREDHGGSTFDRRDCHTCDIITEESIEFGV